MMALSNWNTPRHLDNQLICSPSEKKQVRAFHLLGHASRRRQSEKPLFYFKEINLDLRPLQMAPVTRRQFLKTAMLVSASGAWAKHFPTTSTVSWHERRDLFPEGVASGDPNSNSVLVWT
jgi:hypothetical protein